MVESQELLQNNAAKVRLKQLGRSPLGSAILVERLLLGTEPCKPVPIPFVLNFASIIKSPRRMLVLDQDRSSFDLSLTF